MDISIVRNFLEKHSSLFDGIDFERGLYLRSGCGETFILERKEWKGNRKTFIINFDCGIMYGMRTEVNTMEEYILQIPISDFVEYTTF